MNVRQPFSHNFIQPVHSHLFPADKWHHEREGMERERKIFFIKNLFSTLCIFIKSGFVYENALMSLSTHCPLLLYYIMVCVGPRGSLHAGRGYVASPAG